MNAERTARLVDWSQSNKFVSGLLQPKPRGGLYLEVRCMPRKGTEN